MKWRAAAPANYQALLELTEKARDAFPNNAATWMSLADVLVNLGRAPEAIEVLEEGRTRLSGSAPLYLAMAKVLLRVGSVDAALNHVEQALSLSPDDLSARVLRLQTLVRAERWDEVRSLVDGVAAEAPTVATVFDALARWRETAPDLERLLAHCESALAVDPACTDAVYYKALALAKLSRPTSARKVLSVYEHVREGSLVNEDVGSEQIDSFNKDIRAQIEAHPTLRPDPSELATKGGSQTGRLDHESGALALLMSALRKKISSYVTAMEQASELARRPPAYAELHAWGVIYRRNGAQTSHRHPNGWLSGVYYVDGTPEADGKYRGALLLGALDPDEGVDPPWGVRPVEPRPGNFVLFPSYIPHATDPCATNSKRASVAFDVYPVR